MNWTAFNGIILFTTLIVLLWYAYDTHRIANQTIESSLRPVILRTGQILDWKVLSLEDMKKAKNFNPTLEFTNNKNIATDISGYMILDDKRYDLVFTNNVRGTIINDAFKTEVVYNLKWSWLPSGGNLLASYDKDKFTETTEKNQIYLLYKDIEGNQYLTKEDENFYSTSKKK